MRDLCHYKVTSSQDASHHPDRSNICGVSKNRGKTPKPSICSKGFPLFSPSILGFSPYFWFNTHMPNMPKVMTLILLLEKPLCILQRAWGRSVRFSGWVWFFVGKTPGKTNIMTWAVLSDEQMSKRWQFSLLNDEQMSNWVGVKHQPVIMENEPSEDVFYLLSPLKKVLVNFSSLPC